MKDSKKVISRKNIPVTLPIFKTVIILLALDYWKAPEWLYGVVLALLVILWIGAISLLIKQTQVDIFDDSDPKKESEVSKFQERIVKAMNKDRTN